MVGEVPRGLRYGLLFLDLLAEAVRHSGSFARNGHGERGRASNRSKRGGRVDGESDRAERGRIKENGFPTASLFAIDPDWRSCRQGCRAVDCVDGGVDWPSLVPRGAVAVDVRKEIRVALVSCHSRIVSVFLDRSRGVHWKAMKTELHMESCR